MVYGLGRKNAAGKYSPLSLIQITTDDKSIRTANLSFVPTSLTVDPYKRTIALFLSELLYHVLKHPMVDEPMFDFLAESIRELDSLPFREGEGVGLANFHLQFLVDFAAKLGFAIPESTNPLTTPPLTRKARQEALRALCAYFAEHVETWQDPKSLDVLIEVFD
jgi:DNA repair protein RecO (recombination protein O)